MSIALHPRFWASFFATLLLLSACGFAIAWVLVPVPPTYHRTSYFEFPLPAEWDCDRHGTETVCYPAGEPPHSAIIILTAKWRAGYDNRAFYLEHLGKPQISTSDGEPMVSEVLDLREVRLGDHDWIDGRHFQSELKNFVTRYLATTTTEIGVLVTYSIHRDRLDDYDGVLSDAVAGLQIYQRAGDTPLY